MILNLQAILALVAAYSASDSSPEWPEQREIQGLTDESLWGLIVGDGDVLGGMTFSEAVNSDPRRVDARIQQAVVLPLYGAIQKARGHGSGQIDQLLKHTYLLQNDALRKEHGVLDAEALADAFETSWDSYSKVMQVLFTMHVDEAAMLRQMMIDNRDVIFRSFREATEVAARAIKCANDGSSSQAWARMAAVIANMWMNIERMMIQQLKENPYPIAEGEGEWLEHAPKPKLEAMGGLFGYRPRDSFGSEWEGHIVSGHRAPKLALPQYRRMGGRFYG